MTEDEYTTRKTTLIDALILFLQAGDELGKSQPQMMGEFMSEFNSRAQAAA